MKNILLTGKIGVGKTTVILKLIDRIDGSYGGYLGYCEHENGIRKIKVRSLYNLADDYTIAISDCKNIMEFNRQVFETVLTRDLEKSIEDRDIIVLDELGRLEESCELFKRRVHSALDSEKLVIGVLKKHDGKFINSIKSRDDVQLIEVTPENRGGLAKKLLSEIDSIGYKTRGHDYFSWDPFRIELYDRCLGKEGCDYPGVFIDMIRAEFGDVAGKSLLDIGTGTGAFLIELAKQGLCCTGIDISIEMIEKLLEKARKSDIKNIRASLSSFQKYDSKEKFDIVISAFSAGMSKNMELVEKALDMARENLFIVCKDKDDMDKFYASELSGILGRDINKPKNSRDKKDIIAELEQNGYQFSLRCIEFDFPQYIKSVDEGVDFFKNYFSIRSDETDTLRAFVAKKAVRKGDWLVLPEKRKALFINVKK